MREICTLGSARGAAREGRPYRKRQHLPSQETQEIGRRALRVATRWHYGKFGTPRFKGAGDCLRSLAPKDPKGSMRPVFADGVLTAISFGKAGKEPLVLPLGTPAGELQATEFTRISEGIEHAKLLSVRIGRQKIDTRFAYRVQFVVDGTPPLRHEVGDGRVRFDLGLSVVAVVSERIAFKVAWQQMFSRSIRDRVPGWCVSETKRCVALAGGSFLDIDPFATALSQHCACGAKIKESLSCRTHRCSCGVVVDRDLFSAFLVHFVADVDGTRTLEVTKARKACADRHDLGGVSASSGTKHRGSRRGCHPRAVARRKTRLARRARPTCDGGARVTPVDTLPTALAA